MIRWLMQVAVTMLTAAALVTMPLYAAPQQSQTQGAETAPPAAGTTPPAARNVTLGPNFSEPKPFFPNLLSPYTTRHLDEPMLTNTPRFDQLIKDGKLYLSLDDAISIALEDNLDISVQRFTPWIAETQLLKAKAGGIPQTGNTQQVVLGGSPAVSFDPILTAGIEWARATTPVNNPFLSGVGTSAQVPFVINNQAEYNFGYSQGFHTGTDFSVMFDNTRSSTNSPEVLFNPAVQSTMTITLSQPLLNGFGILPNTRYILEAKNSIKSATAVFSNQVIVTTTAVATDYWELVYARENVKVAEAAVGVDQKLYDDNKKQLQIGTMAPLDVLTAESQLASDQQVLVQAQTTQLQDETTLLVVITKDPLAGNLMGIEIVPTTPISTPDTETVSLQDAVKEAWSKRPELFEAQMSLKNADIEAKVSKNSLLPSLTAFAQYGATGLGGTKIIDTPTGTFVPDTTTPLVDANGVPIVLGVQGPVYAGVSNFAQTTQPGGLGDTLANMINQTYPTYAFGVNLTLPIRNRSAQADNARALLDQRQQQVQYRQTQNQIVLNVRNALIALVQDRASVAAAEKARTLAQQTLDDEQKKYQLGTSTSYNVVLRSRDLTAAEGTELRDRINLIEAELNFNEAMGRTLEVNHILVSDSLKTNVHSDPQIPGEPNWDAKTGQK